MKPERLIRATYADILDSADPATIRVIGDLDAIYTSAPTPATPPFSALLATRARAASRATTGDGPETAIRGIAGGAAPPHSRRGWLRQGFAFAGAALAFALVATLLVLLFRSDDESSTPGAQPDASPTAIPAVATATTGEILYIGTAEDGRDAVFAARADGSSARLIVSARGAQAPVWSPDGQHVAVSGDEFGVFVIEADGDNLSVVAESGDGLADLDLAWSPDGTQLAFRRHDPTAKRQNLYLVNADGSNLRVLVDSGAAGLSGLPAWSPDGQQIAFVGHAGAADADYLLFVVDAAGGEPRQIGGPVADISPPSWSSDGTQILFTQATNSGADVAVVDLDGNLSILTDTPGSDGFPAWSPDGSQIAFKSDRDGANALYVMNADGTNARRVAAISTGNHSLFDWSPDGQSITYATFPDDGAPGTLHVVNTDGSDAQIVAEGLRPRTQPDWSPVIAPTDTATPEPSSDVATPTSPTPAGPHPDQIAFTSIQDGNPEIYLVNADGSGLTRLTNDPAADREPAWSPDGARIAFVSDRSGELRLYVMNADGSHVQLLTDEAGGVAVPVWSPDGEWIAFVAFTEDGFLDIFIIHADGSGLRRLTDWQAIDTDPAWSPTSQQVVYRSDAGQGGMDDIFIVNIDGSGHANLTNDVISQREPEWSRDGTRIAFSHASLEVDMGQGAVGFYDTIAIYNTTMQGGDPFQETDILGSSPRWSPDGHYLVYNHPASEPDTSVSSTQIVHILNVDTLESSLAPGFEGAMPNYDWSPGGERLVVAITNVDTDGNPGDERSLWLAPLDGSEPILLAEQLDSWARPAWRADPLRTPEPSKTPPDLALPTATPDTREPSEPVTPNALDNMAPLQPGQERHFVFDIRADYRIDQSNFLRWNVKGSERMLPDGTLQTYVIARDADYNVLVEYVNDGERWWWNQRGWIEAGTTAEGVSVLPEELRLAMEEPQSAHRALTTDAYEVIDSRSEGDAQFTRFRLDDTQINDVYSGFEQIFETEVESAYYEVYSTIDLAVISRTRTILVTPDDEELSEYVASDITFESVILIDAEDGPGNYVVPEAPADDIFRYTPPATMPSGLTIESHSRQFGLEQMVLRSDDGPGIGVSIYPSRGGYDSRAMQDGAARIGGLVVATGFIAGGDIAWTAEEANGWPIRAIWDNGRYRIELNIANVTSREQWNEDDLVALIYALAGEQQN